MALFYVFPSSGLVSRNFADADAERAERVRPGLTTTTCEVSRAALLVPRDDATRAGVACAAQARLIATEVSPGDSLLDGRLFRWSWGQVPTGSPPPPFASFAGYSRQVSWRFDERHVGLWLLTCWRPRGGSSALPIEVRLIRG